MIILAIKTDVADAELYLFVDNKQQAAYAWPAGRHLAETLLSRIDEFLNREHLRINDLGGIAVYSGPGSFTGLRIGHSVANALAYGLHIPIVGRTGNDWARQAVRQLETGANDHLSMPVYGSPVHITKPRK